MPSKSVSIYFWAKLAYCFSFLLPIPLSLKCFWFVEHADYKVIGSNRQYVLIPHCMNLIVAFSETVCTQSNQSEIYKIPAKELPDPFDELLKK